MTPPARPGRQPPPAAAHAGEHRFGFGVIGDVARVGARHARHGVIGIRFARSRHCSTACEAAARAVAGYRGWAGED